jgi:hypothetical protein
VNFYTYGLKGPASEEISHAIEHFALEALNVDLDNRRERVARGDD